MPRKEYIHKEAGAQTAKFLFMKVEHSSHLARFSFFRRTKCRGAKPRLAKCEGDAERDDAASPSLLFDLRSVMPRRSDPAVLVRARPFLSTALHVLGEEAESIWAQEKAALRRSWATATLA